MAAMSQKERALLAETVGRDNEQRALATARALHNEGIFPFDSESPAPELSLPSSADDMEGIDLWISTHKGLVGIQIKSSLAYARLFIQNHQNGRVIPTVVVNDTVSDEKLKVQLISAATWAMDLWFGDQEE